MVREIAPVSPGEMLLDRAFGWLVAALAGQVRHRTGPGKNGRCAGRDSAAGKRVMRNPQEPVNEGEAV